MKTGIAGTLARLFIKSKLTPLLMVVFIIVGMYSSYLTPREEEPQIDVPIADIFIGYPGASPSEIESKIITPIEKVISNVKGVEYVYSQSLAEQGMLIVQFYVGEDIERSLVKLYNEIMKNMDQMPAGVTLPLIKTRSIDDVPVMSLTLWSERYDDYQLKRVAQELTSEVEKITDVSETKLLGGRNREIQIVLDPDKMTMFKSDPLMITQQLQAANQQVSAGSFNQSNKEYVVRTGKFFESSEEVANLIVGVYQKSPVYLHQVATIEDGPAVPNSYVAFGYGKASVEKEEFADEYSAVTISIAKRRGADAMRLAEQINKKVEDLRSDLIPADINVEVTRNYGETASDKVGELLMHLLGAIIAVTFVVMLAMGWRGGLVVFISVPITFALTMASYYFLDYTLNRITLFALVFVTGIVVDDSIIIAENMHRHFKMKQLPFWQAALRSIDEVGNPTILATFTVIAAVIPMVFVSGMMGPYMSPMPIGASIAMIFSLLVALMITPWLAYRLLKHDDSNDGDKDYSLEKTLIYRLYDKTMRPMIESPLKRWVFIGGVTLLLFGSASLFLFKVVTVKILPFDNKNEFQVVIDMPEGTTLEETANVTKELAAYLRSHDLVTNYQTYVGTSAPINFNGLVRHYDLRRGSNVADIQVNLVSKKERDLQSHDIAKELRPGLQAIGERFNANVKVVEVPPGPPVMSTLVAEIYGPDYEAQKEVGKQVKDLFESTESVVDVDWMMEGDQIEYHFEVDKEKAMMSGIAPQQIIQAVNMALRGATVSQLYAENDHQQVGITLRLAEDNRTNVDDLKKISLLSSHGNMVPVGDLVDVKQVMNEKSIFRKNQKQVVYVTADVAGDLESPVYAILDMSDRMDEIVLPDGYDIEEFYNGQPFDESNFGLKWDGEWQITYEVFRDLGTAFAVVLVIIYMLIVGWFQNLRVPFVMMVAIPLSLVGIVLGHWMLDAFFTATSMIGMIALAGIMVRNSILLIDFVNIRLNEGVPLREAVIEAGAVRTTPILLTAGTVVIGAVVILFDPIFQGLAISLMGGTIASTVLTLLIVPLIFFMTERKKHEENEPLQVPAEVTIDTEELSNDNQ